MRRIEAVDRVLEAANLLFERCKACLRLGVIVGGAHGRNVLAHRGAKVAAAGFLVEQRGIFVVEFLQELICFGGSVVHGGKSFLLLVSCPQYSRKAPVRREKNASVLTFGRCCVTLWSTQCLDKENFL